MNKSFKILSSLCLIVALSTVLVGIVAFIQFRTENSKIHSFSQNTSKNQIKKNEIWFESKLDGSWQTDTTIGAKYDFIWYNNTKVDITDWQISIVIPTNTILGSAWNGSYTKDGNRILLSSVNYNEVNFSHSSIPFGFVLDFPITDDNSGIWEPSEFYVTYKQSLSIHNLPVYLHFEGMLCVLAFLILYMIVLKVKDKDQLAIRKEYTDIIDQAFAVFANIIDIKDPYTKGHSKRVALYSKEIARRMGFTQKTQERIYYCGMMHDIGKIGISDEILKKPESLTDEERETMKIHTTYSENILKSFTSIQDLGSIAKSHHEWYDGSGYPDHLKGDEIPQLTRIITVADCYDTMSSNRCYKEASGNIQIIDELQKNAGIQFDPAIVPIMVEMIKDGSVAHLVG